MTDQDRKTLRSFYCRDYLWELFEQMTHEQGCSMDFLINEAMRLYGRERAARPLEVSAPHAPPGPPPLQGYGSAPLAQGSSHLTYERMPAVGAPSHVPPIPPRSTAPGVAAGPPPPPRSGAGGWTPAPLANQYASAHGLNATGPTRPPLTLTFDNHRYPIERDKFIIGRGSQQTDLMIRDGNISRKHCAVIFHNGTYYIKDLGSTNGIEYRGKRIESKRIEEGDVFYLCDYELRFHYT